MITAGNANDGLMMLTGAPGSWYLNSTKLGGDIFTDIKNWLQAGYNVLASTLSGGKGLASNHAYAILGVNILKDGT